MADVAIGDFLMFLEGAHRAMAGAAEGAMERACQVVEHEAREEIGSYQGAAAPFPAWAELADSTKADRVRQGFPENDPLLRTGEMRDSIGHSVVATGVGTVEGTVGSTSQIAVYQELGTDRIPPRSFLGGALMREEAVVVKILGDAAHWALTGGKQSGQLE